MLTSQTPITQSHSSSWLKPFCSSGWIAVLLALWSWHYNHGVLYSFVLNSYLDGSWVIGLSLIRKMGAVYGRDFVFTYGPLAHLNTRFFYGVAPWELLLFDCWWLLQTGWIIRVVLGKRLSWLRTVLVAAGVVLLNSPYGTEPCFFVLYSALFALCSHLCLGQKWLLVYAYLLVLVALYTKVNVGIIGLTCYLGYLLYWAVSRRRSLFQSVSVVLACGTALWGSARLLRVDLSAYVINSLYIIRSYNDVMQVYPKHAEVILLTACLLTALAALMMLTYVWRHRSCLLQRTPPDDLVVICLSGITCFMLFKHGFVRADQGHYAIFFKYICHPLLLLLVFLPYDRVVSRLVVLIIGAAIIAHLRFNPSDPELFPVRKMADYLSDIAAPKRIPIQDYKPYPSAWLSRLRPATVDVLPVDIATLFANGLEPGYRPRPVFQTYQVTEAYLDAINARFYNSPEAPQFLIYTHEAIDDRYPFADEVQTKLAMLARYEVVDQKGKLTLLQRRSQPLNIDTLKVTTRGGRLNAPIAVPEDLELGLLQVQAAYTLPGAAERLLFQPPSFLMEMETEQGRHYNYRIGRPTLANGVLMSRLVQTDIGFRRFFESRGQAGWRIRRLWIRAERWNWAIQPVIRVRFIRLKVVEDHSRLSAEEPVWPPAG